jgi:hypothetical protein
MSYRLHQVRPDIAVLRDELTTGRWRMVFVSNATPGWRPMHSGLPGGDSSNEIGKVRLWIIG